MTELSVTVGVQRWLRVGIKRPQRHPPPPFNKKRRGFLLLLPPPPANKEKRRFFFVSYFSSSSHLVLYVLPGRRAGRRNALKAMTRTRSSRVAFSSLVPALAPGSKRGASEAEEASLVL